MKVVILAAGKGMRLSDGDLPKPLTALVNGKSILENQLGAISQMVSLDRVIVVVGYHKEAIMDRFPNLLYVYNPDFSHENTSKSLLRALNKCEEDVMWINGDVVFHPSVLKTLLEKPRTGMVVNIGSVGDEEVKYRQSTDGRILEVSKHIENPQGEALGINYCSASDLERFRQNLNKCAPNDYFERGLELCIEEGMAVWSVPVKSDLCAEVDFPEDLVRANRMIQQW